MNIKTVKLNKLTEAEVNARRHSETQIEAFKKSVEQFGQIRPIVVDEDYEIIAGHGLKIAMEALGLTEGKVLIMTGISEVDKRKLMLADNKIYELGSADNDGIMQLMNEIKFDFNGDLDIPGYDADILDSVLVGSLDDIDEVITEYGKVDEERVEKISEIIERKNEEELLSKPQEMVLNESVVKVQPATKTESARPYAICPNCGEHVWL